MNIQAKAIDAVGVVGIHKLGESGLAVIDRRRMEVLELVADLANKLRAVDGMSGTAVRRFALYRALSRLEAQTDGESESINER